MSFDVSPPADCRACDRLAAFRDANRAAFPAFRNAPVESFGDPSARLLIVGLAPGLRGANRTGRPFTGDYAGDLLYATLLEFGFAKGVYDRRPDDGLALNDCATLCRAPCVKGKRDGRASRARRALSWATRPRATIAARRGSAFIAPAR